jgi:hypothetical protein
VIQPELGEGALLFHHKRRLALLAVNASSLMSLPVDRRRSKRSTGTSFTIHG